VRERGVDLEMGEPEVPLLARAVPPLRSLARRWDTAFALQSILVLVCVMLGRLDVKEDLGMKAMC
jgi:hypothetical protein